MYLVGQCLRHHQPFISEKAIMKQQQGFTIVITVVLLMVAAIIGLYAMRSAITQDKASANIYNKTISHNAAEHGASQFYQWASTRFLNNGWPAAASDRSSSVWGTMVPADSTGSANIGDNGYFWINTTDDISGCATRNTNPCWDDTNKQVTALITGNLVKGSGISRTVLGESKVRIKIAAAGTTKIPDMPGALTLGGTVTAFDAATSNAFGITGNSKLAIATGDSGSNTVVKNAIRSSRIANYTCLTTNCISNTDLGIWNRPTDLTNFINSIADSPLVTLVKGDAHHPTLPTCSGVLVITGNFYINGRGCGVFEGVIIVLGGTVHINGGGNLNINGGLYVAKMTITPSTGTGIGSASFGNQRVDEGFIVNGGGNMNITYNNSYFASLDDILSGKYMNRAYIKDWADVI